MLTFTGLFSLHHFYCTTGVTSVGKLLPFSLHHGCVGVFRANFVGHLQQRTKSGGVDAGIAACFANGSQYILCSDVTDQRVSCKGTTAQAGQRGVEAATAGFIGGKNFFFGVFGAAVEMDA